MTTRDPLPSITADAERVARIAIAEDGDRDVTSDALPAHANVCGLVVVKEPAVVAGVAYATAVCDQLECRSVWRVVDGTIVEAQTPIGTLRGSLSAVLRAERPMLNLLQRATGIATTTRTYVEVLAGTGCKLLHTRKTAPGLRLLDVQAVMAGGGGQHRLGLDRELMVKDNHWAALAATGGSLRDVVASATARGVEVIHVEVENAAQIREAIEVGATRLLIDNRTPEVFRELARLARELDEGVEVEATGNLTLDIVGEYAAGGAQFASVGALTHSVRAADIGIEFELSS